MAQVLVNFRIDEDVKKSMEQACKEMGLSMSTAFTIFAKKVGKEKRIPFEITAESQRTQPRQRAPGEAGQGDGGEALMIARRQERLELHCTSIRRSLTAIRTAIPAAITGLSMERIRLLCGDELKDKAARITNSARSLFSERSAEMLPKKDLSLLDEYIDELSSAVQDLLEIEYTLIPAMKAWRAEGDTDFGAFEQRLAALSQKLDGLPVIMQRFLCSTACVSGARAVRSRLRQAARTVETAYVLTALESLEKLVDRHYDALKEQTRTRLETHYLQTLELALRQLSQAEQGGGDVAGKAALCLRVINVLAQVISENGQIQQDLRAWDLEAEVEALESLAAMRGDIAGSLQPEV